MYVFGQNTHIATHVSVHPALNRYILGSASRVHSKVKKSEHVHTPAKVFNITRRQKDKEIDFLKTV